MTARLQGSIDRCHRKGLPATAWNLMRIPGCGYRTVLEALENGIPVGGDREGDHLLLLSWIAYAPRDLARGSPERQRFEARIIAFGLRAFIQP